jgi:hypothetical protein
MSLGRSLYGSRVMPVVFRGCEVLVKRDDELGPLAGNKARKAYALLTRPELTAHFDVLCSYGGAQSNAMESLASVAAILGKGFVYFTRRLPNALRASPSGNLAAALARGMEIKEFVDEKTARACAEAYGMCLLFSSSLLIAGSRQRRHQTSPPGSPRYPWADCGGRCALASGRA